METNQLLYLSRADVEEVGLEMATIIELLGALSTAEEMEQFEPSRIKQGSALHY